MLALTAADLQAVQQALETIKTGYGQVVIVVKAGRIVRVDTTSHQLLDNGGH